MSQDRVKLIKKITIGKPFWLWVAIVLLVAVSSAALLGILRATEAVRLEAQERFFEQYNRQQLLMAEQTARAIEQTFTVFRRNLSIVVSLFEQEGATTLRVAETQATFERIYQGLANTAIIDLVVFNKEGTVVAISPHDTYTLGRNYAWRHYYLWAKNEGKRGEMFLSPFMRLAGGQNRGAKALFVAQGIYDQKGAFEGVVMMTLNFDQLAKEMIMPVRIGKHGFAWLVDNDEQVVLVDPAGRVTDKSFKDSFLPHWPNLYQLLQSTSAGQPGMGAYDYTDPVDPTKPVHKLVGYHPVKIENRLWTLGVTTPAREVDAQLSHFLQQQERFSGTLMMIIFAGTFILCAVLLYWNHQLSRQVSRRTADLAVARERLEATFDELLASKKLVAVGHLALGLAHEIRNPLSAIRMNIQMIRKKSNASGSMQESFDIVEGEILRLNHLVNDVMDFARPRPLRLESVVISDIIHRVLQLHGETLNELGVTIETHMDEVLVAICDSEQIEQVILNLVSNAMEALEETDIPRRLSIYVKKYKPHVFIQVIDTGGGVQQKDQDKIFEPFFTTKSAGGGLGLPTIQGIVIKHQGSITYESDENGQSCFTVFLPLNGPVVDEEHSDENSISS